MSASPDDKENAFAASDFPAIGKKLTARPTCPAAWSAKLTARPSKPAAWSSVVKSSLSTTTPAAGVVLPAADTLTPTLAPTSAPTIPSGLTPSLASLSASTPSGEKTAQQITPTQQPAAGVSLLQPTVVHAQSAAATASGTSSSPDPADGAPVRRILTAADMVRRGKPVACASTAAASSSSPPAKGSPHACVAAAAMKLVKRIGGADEVGGGGRSTGGNSSSSSPPRPSTYLAAVAQNTSRASSPTDPYCSARSASPGASSTMSVSSPRPASPVLEEPENIENASSSSPAREEEEEIAVEAIEADAAVSIDDPSEAEAAAAAQPEKGGGGSSASSSVHGSPACRVLNLTAPMPTLTLPPPSIAAAAAAQPNGGRGPIASPCKRSGERLSPLGERPQAKIQATGQQMDAGGGALGVRVDRPKKKKNRKKDRNGTAAAALQQVHGGVNGAGLHFLPPPLPTAHHHAPALPPLPPPTVFEGRSASMPLPHARAIEALDRSIADFYKRTREAASALDGPATAMMRMVQAEVSSVWPNACVACFGSRATGLAGANSDVDLVVTGVPGLDGMPPDGSLDTSRGPLPAQLDALRLLLPRLAQLKGVATASVNKSAVPVIALTADVPAEAEVEKGTEDAESVTGESSSSADSSDCGADGAAARSTAAASASSPPQLCMDVSINTPLHRGLMAAHHVRWLHSQLPFLPPLVMLLKALLHKHSLKTTYTGGLSSYALVTMVSRFLLDRHALLYLRPPQTPPPQSEAVAPPAALEPIQPPLPPEPPSDSAKTTTTEVTIGAMPPLPPMMPPLPPPQQQPTTGGLVGGGSLSGGMICPIGVVPSLTHPVTVTPTLGTLLLELLTFYGEVYEPSTHAVLGSYGMYGAPPPGCGFVERKSLGPLLASHEPMHGQHYHQGLNSKRRPPTPFQMEPLVCVDPVDVHNNSAKSCYRVGQLRTLFCAAAKAVSHAAEVEAESVKNGAAPNPMRVIEALLNAE